MSAELFDIYKALELVLSHGDLQSPPVVIFTDSKSSLYLIRNTRCPTYASIVFRISMLLFQKGLTLVSLCWVKSHSGVRGNEIADQTANFSHSTDRSSHSILGFEELMCQLRQSFLTQWKEH
jgi:ribonuclease HI